MAEGIFSSQIIRDFIKKGFVRSYIKIAKDQIQPSSLDLRVGKNAWRVPASFLVKDGRTVLDEIRIYRDSAYKIDLSKKSFIEMGKTYVVELAEELNLPKGVKAVVNPKSSSGRIDVFVRLITENGKNFDSVDQGYSGKLYIILFSNSFDLLLKQGVSLNQIRFFAGTDYDLRTNELKMLYSRNALLFRKDGKAVDIENAPIKEDGLFLSIDLDNSVVGYRSKKNTGPVDLTKVKSHAIDDYWEIIRGNSDKSLILDPHYFYILKTNERVAIPLDFAAEMVPFHSGIGEFRSHYAGFFDPGFGFGSNGQIKGSYAVMEVRIRDLPMKVHHNQKFAKLVYKRMAQKPDLIYGVNLKSNYQGQGLRLSKHFI